MDGSAMNRSIVDFFRCRRSSNRVQSFLVFFLVSLLVSATPSLSEEIWAGTSATINKQSTCSGSLTFRKEVVGTTITTSTDQENAINHVVGECALKHEDRLDELRLEIEEFDRYCSQQPGCATQWEQFSDDVDCQNGYGYVQCSEINGINWQCHKVLGAAPAGPNLSRRLCKWYRKQTLDKDLDINFVRGGCISQLYGGRILAKLSCRRDVLVQQQDNQTSETLPIDW
ncbi:MAG: hypothetical protein KDD70_09325 [Bdellovibrionales bacterium]|nr:hypothetical protein [Bdellovibrionales bacterium]